MPVGVPLADEGLVRESLMLSDSHSLKTEFGLCKHTWKRDEADGSLEVSLSRLGKAPGTWPATSKGKARHGGLHSATRP